MSTKTRFDVVVIGSGAGGAPIAYEMVLAGKSVLVLEKGPLLRYQHEHPRGLSDFKRDELFATGAEKRLQLEVSNKGRSYYSSHIEPDLNDEPHVYRTPEGRDEATIEGYTAQVDPARFGWTTHAFVELYCEGRMAAGEVRAAVADHPEVAAAYTVAGEASAMLHVRARDTAHLEQTLERIRDAPGVTRTQTQIVLSTLFERPFSA